MLPPDVRSRLSILIPHQSRAGYLTESGLESSVLKTVLYLTEYLFIQN